MNLRVAAAARGTATSVEEIPVSEAPDLLARVKFEGELDEALAALSTSIAARRTYRKAFDYFDETDVLNDLVAAAEV